MHARRLCAMFVGSVLLFASPIARAADLGAYSAALESISADDLQRHVDVLADDIFEGREAGSRGNRAAATYLKKQMYDSGLAGGATGGKYFQTFANGYRNLLGLLRGSDPELADETIVVGAHYDHVGYGTSGNSRGEVGYIHNGADDNASGAAALLEVIEAFASVDHAPKRSILFALWDGEEKGLLGSKHWADNPTVPLARVPIVVNVDMIGRLRKHHLEIGGSRTTWGLRRLLSQHTHDTDLRLDFVWNTRSNSDHWPFYQRDKPIVALHTGLHENYHRPSDDSHTVNAEGMRQITRFLFGSIVALANAEHLSGFRRAARRETPAMRRKLETSVVAAPRRLGVRWGDEQQPARGLLLTHVYADSAAERGGLRAGDRVRSFAGRSIDNGDELRTAVLAAGEKLDVVVERAGQPEPQTLSLTLPGKPVTLGVSWREDEAEPGAILLTRVLAGSPAERAGLTARDRIYQIDGTDFANGEEFLLRMRQASGEIEMLVESQGQLRTVRVELLPNITDPGTPSP